MIGVSYARISSAGQAGGSGIARQTANPEAYCNARGWRLWQGQPYSDPGVSAFAGDHLQGGDLGRFLADHRAGRFGGEPVALLLEDVDRFSRAFPLAVLPVLVDDSAITWLLTHHPVTRDEFSDAAADRRVERRTMASVVDAIASSGLPPEQERLLLLNLQARGLGAAPAEPEDG